MTKTARTPAACIEAEREALGRLTELLRDEQRALVTGDLEKLASYADPKAKLLFELSRCADERAHLLRTHGYAADAAGMDNLLRKLGDDTAAVVSDWQRLLDDSKLARQLNETNGTLIAARMRGTQQALGVLLRAARIPGTYAADGTTVGLHRTNRLAVV